jgi:hypothetical protein
MGDMASVVVQTLRVSSLEMSIQKGASPHTEKGATWLQE